MPLEVRSLAEWEAAGVAGMLSVVIPAHNEEGHIAHTIRAVHKALADAQIHHEILVVNDNSRDATETILKQVQVEIPELRYINNNPPNGFGFAVRCGLAEFRGDAVAIVMADLSDDPADLVAFYRKMHEGGFDCVFGSRFMRGGKLVDYPLVKLLINRLGNLFIQLLFLLKFNDATNAFKLYRRSVIAGLQPLLAYHFNLTVELPLKAIVRGYTYAVVPNAWYNRKEGVSKFKIKEMGSRYLFIIFYCWLERRLSMRDYGKTSTERLKETQLQVWHR
jgi:dolichol-phosphate mannosyltransferase